MSPPTSPIARLLGWAIPIALIFVGLVFVTASLTGSDEPDVVSGPPSVRDVTAINAPGWASRQVAAGATTRGVKASLVASEATGPDTYSIRALIGRIDTAADQTESSITTCVLWTVDVVTGGITEHGATELRIEAGAHPFDAGDDELHERCAAAAFDG